MGPYCENSQSSYVYPLTNLEDFSSAIHLSIFLTGLCFCPLGVSFLSIILHGQNRSEAAQLSQLTFHQCRFADMQVAFKVKKKIIGFCRLGMWIIWQ